VPPRDPEEDPPPPTPDPALPGEATDPSPEGDKNDNTASQPSDQTNNVSQDEPQLTQPPEQTGNGGQDEPQLTQPPEQTGNGGQDEVQPTPAPNQKSDEIKNQTIPAQPSQDEDQVDSASATLPQADLSLSQTVDNPRPNLGEVITLTVAISNNGPSSATEIIVSDPLPPGLTLSSTTPSRGSYNSDTGLWAIGIITYSESVTLSLVVTVTSAGIVTNTAEITAAHPSDPNSTPGNGLEREDDWASVPISVRSDYDPLTFASVSTSASGSLPEWAGSLSWLYALCLGVFLILSGIYLVNRA
jgi:uncharacterized repeat protein (TIGR01451 family)